MNITVNCLYTVKLPVCNIKTFSFMITFKANFML